MRKADHILQACSDYCALTNKVVKNNFNNIEKQAQKQVKPVPVVKSMEQMYQQLRASNGVANGYFKNMKWHGQEIADLSRSIDPDDPKASAEIYLQIYNLISENYTSLSDIIANLKDAGNQTADIIKTLSGKNQPKL